MKSESGILKTYEYVGKDGLPIYKTESININKDQIANKPFEKPTLNLFTYKFLEQVDEEDVKTYLINKFIEEERSALKNFLSNLPKIYSDEEPHKEKPHLSSDYALRIEKGESIFGEYEIDGQIFGTNQIDKKVLENSEKMDRKIEKYGILYHNIIYSKLNVAEVQVKESELLEKINNEKVSLSEINRELESIYKNKR